MFWLLLAIRNYRKIKALPKPNLEAIDQMARAYGYEVGMGEPIKAVINAHGDNPFLDANWREAIVDG